MPLIDMATVLSQVPYVQNVAGAQQSVAAVQQASVEQAVQHAFDLQKSQVQKIEAADTVEEASKDREKDKGKNRHYHAAGNRSDTDEVARQAEETTASNASPWSGNIIDVKI